MTTNRVEKCDLNSEALNKEVKSHRSNKLNIEKVLRQVPTEEKVFRFTRRVQVVKAVDCIMALSKLGLGSKEIKEELQNLLNKYKLFKVKVIQNREEHIEPSYSKILAANDLYMWAEEKYDYKTLILSLSLILLALALGMFRLWPTKLKRATFSLLNVAYVLLGLCIVVSILRLIVFVCTYVVKPPGLWILPNLWEDCGFFESFVPAYAWADQNVSHKKKED